MLAELLVELVLLSGLIVELVELVLIPGLIIELVDDGVKLVVKEVNVDTPQEEKKCDKFAIKDKEAFAVKDKEEEGEEKEEGEKKEEGEEEEEEALLLKLFL